MRQTVKHEFIDIKNKAILDESGVRKVYHPRLHRASAIIGGTLLKLAGQYRNTILLHQSEYTSVSYDTEPQLARQIGGTVLTAGAVVMPVAATAELAPLVDEYLAGTLQDPLYRLSQLRFIAQ